MKKSYKADHITLRHLYLMYDYKWYDIYSSTVPVPYFPKSEISDHVYKLSFKEWKRIIVSYLKYLLLYLLAGSLFKIPSQLGRLCFRKKKSNGRRVDIGRTTREFGEINRTLPKEKRKFAYFNNHHTAGYTPYIKWLRDTEKLKYKWHWRFNISKRMWKKISNEIMKNPSIMNKFSNS